MQRALMQYNMPQNYNMVVKALEKAGRRDLIGRGDHCLVSERIEPSRDRRAPRGKATPVGKAVPSGKPAPRGVTTHSERHAPAPKAIVRGGKKR